MQFNGIEIPKTQTRIDHEDRIKKQEQRKAEGKPVKVTNEQLYDMLSEMLENQVYITAKLENMR